MLIVGYNKLTLVIKLTEDCFLIRVFVSANEVVIRDTRLEIQRNNPGNKSLLNQFELWHAR